MSDRQILPEFELAASLVKLVSNAHRCFSLPGQQMRIAAWS
jgi:hypothetical protein